MSQWFESYGWAPVHPGLLVGAIPLDANDVQALIDAGVGTVLNLAEDREYPDGARLEVEIAMEVNGLEEQRIGLVDFGNLSRPALEQAVGSVDAWLEEGRTVYLHCRAGWQRSATVAAGVIALRERVGIEEALGRLRARKPTAAPLPHQREDLRAWWAQRPTTPAG